MSERRRLSRTDREWLYLRADGHCQRCGVPIAIETFHAAHLRAHANGGPAIVDNLEAWCAACNWAQGAHDVRDPRVVPRAWQRAAIPAIVERIVRSGAATVAAAPGAGKTLLACFVYEQLYAIGHVDRVVVFVPNRTLVDQWHEKLLGQRHVELHRDVAQELPGTDGVVVTYQSLTPKSLRNHQCVAADKPTLVILDEVHHLGERVGRQLPGWTHWIRQLVGTVDVGLSVAGVLNLSGTLWRSKTTERIATVRYVTEADGRILSDVDHDITALDLIDAGELRRVDLFRVGATVTLRDDWRETRTVSRIAELNVPGGRAVLKDLPERPEWRARFVGDVLDRLERAYRDLGERQTNAKALIVAGRQYHAKLLERTAAELLRARGWTSMSSVAVSDDGPLGKAALEAFKQSARPGVLCTVNMVSEGFDCESIAVIGYATAITSELYVRQIIARAQRVTAYERAPGRHPIVATVIAPDVPEVIEKVRNILAPMRHEFADEDEERPGPDDDEKRRRQGPDDEDIITCDWRTPRYAVEDVRDIDEENAFATGIDDDEGVRPALIRAAEPHARAAGIPETYMLRAIQAARRGARDYRDEDPFRPVRPEEAALAEPPAPRHYAAPQTTPLGVTGIAAVVGERLQRAAGWAKLNMTSIAVNDFVAECNARAGLPRRGGRPRATPKQLRQALAHAERWIAAYCEQTGIPRPTWLTSDRDLEDLDDGDGA
jgi:superfamily II DNA or RNA helicase